MSQLPLIRHPDLLVGLDGHDDAGVFRLSADLAVIQTVDYFTPIVDDPHEFGEIAAANALSDVYAMGGQPLTAMNIVGFPVNELDLSVLREVMRGGYDMCQRAGVVLVGGHSVKSPELFFGLSVLGRIHPEKIVTNAGARAGDLLALTKPIGTGVLTTALKKGTMEAGQLAGAIAMMKRLNERAGRLMVELEAHACTDVTGFGLLGHLSEMTSASGVSLDLWADRVPLFSGALEHSRAGDKPGGLGANRSYFEGSADKSPKLTMTGTIDPALADLLFDPQTSGGLLVSLLPRRAEEFIAALHAAGEIEAAIIGEFREGPGDIRVRFR